MKRRSMDSNNKHALLLGMFHGSYSKKKLGQEFRDKIRCDAMVKRGYNVKTLDNKHDKEDLVKNHCYANFTSRKMIPSMEEKWGKSISFDQVILDYFFCPVSLLCRLCMQYMLLIRTFSSNSRIVGLKSVGTD